MQTVISKQEDTVCLYCGNWFILRWQCQSGELSVWLAGLRKYMAKKSEIINHRLVCEAEYWRTK